MKKRIARITNAYQDSGVGSRAYELARRMPSNDTFAFDDILLDGTTRALHTNGTIVKALPKWPSLIGAKSITWVRLARFLEAYDGYDITNQSLSFIAHKRQPSIITVHDIIELTNPQSRTATLFNKYLASGIPKANHIVTVSEYTKQAVINYFSYPEKNISVIHNGVSEQFQPITDFPLTIGYQTIIKDLKLSNRGPFVLFVGSEHPRKNFAAVLHVIANLKKEYPDIVCIKVGEPGLPEGRRETLRIIDELHIRENIVLLGKVSEDRLIDLYRLATLLLFPSKLEGFGMPPLQAMACGCPVVCSNTTSLPEVIGDAALTCDPDDVETLTAYTKQILENPVQAEALSQKGIARAKQFSWDVAAKRMLELYTSLI